MIRIIYFSPSIIRTFTKSTTSINRILRSITWMLNYCKYEADRRDCITAQQPQGANLEAKAAETTRRCGKYRGGYYTELAVYHTIIIIIPTSYRPPARFPRPAPRYISVQSNLDNSNLKGNKN